MSKPDFYTEKYITVVGTLAPSDASLVCSQHKTPEAAKRAADKCEESGGSKHTIWRVERVA